MLAPTIAIAGEPVNACIYQPRRKVRAGTGPGKADPIWDVALKPKFETPIAQEGMLQPHGSAMPWHAMEFKSRHTELSWLVQTQQRELASLPEEFRANGLSAMSLSSSPNGESDDDLEAANLAEQHLGLVPLDPDPVTLAPLLRRIEWEKYIFRCGLANRVYVTRNDAGQKVIRCTDRRANPAEFAARFTGLDLDEIENNRERAAHYRQLVWSLMTPDEQLAWTRRQTAGYLDFADDNVTREREPLMDEEATGGPQEIGLDGESELVADGPLLGHVTVTAKPTEPSEFDLWPLTPEELLDGPVPLSVHIARADAAWSAMAR